MTELLCQVISDYEIINRKLCNKMKKTFYLSLLLFFISTQFSWAQKSDSTDAKNFNFRFYPYLFYTPETQLAFGAAAISYFRTSRDSLTNLSKVTLSGYYSTRKQYYAVIRPEFYLKQNAYRLYLDANFGKFYDKFWGVGNNTPDIETVDYVRMAYGFQLNLQTRVYGNIKGGAIFEIKNSTIKDKKDNPYLLYGNLTGSDGGMNSGIGAAFSYDNRDNIFYPGHGGFLEFQAIMFDEMLGGDFNFQRYLLNYRQYSTLVHNHILALQLYGDFTSGVVPFYELPALGGQNTMRGYFLGRYRDKQYVMAQAEYRTIVWWRLGMVGFFGLGDVAPQLSALRLDELKYSVGAGVRFVLDAKEKLNVRMDIGFGKDTAGLYFAIEEAF
jgi:outer membrane protein assembly factor BamA